MFSRKKWPLCVCSLITGSCCVFGSDDGLLRTSGDVLKFALEISTNGGLNSIAETKEKIDLSLNGLDNTEDIPDGIKVNIDDWKKSQKSMLLWFILQSFQDLEIVSHCLNLIKAIYDGGTDATFKYARGLLISQCSKWDEASANDDGCTLKRGYNKLMISFAIARLTSATNGDKTSSKNLLHVLKKFADFSPYIQE